MFADIYSIRNKISGKITHLPHPDLAIVIVIPCFREPEILKTLRSVSQCRLPESSVEVIVVINHSETSTEETKSQNCQTRKELDYWSERQSSDKLNFFVIGPVEFKKKWAGAGLARKLGMDEAVLRFNMLNKPDGIIVSLDADTLADENYLLEISNHFRENPFQAGATISFSHQTEGLNEKHLEGVLLYEKYMGYYKRAMGFTGYPYPMFTVGSAFAVTAGAYVKRGGMNRRQAGEDFYFLQNLVQIGPVGEITSTAVHPSARLSNRVPFGTGPVLRKWMEGEEDLKKTYSFKAFADLKFFFDRLSMFYHISVETYNILLADLPQSVETFLKYDDFWNELNVLNNNCATFSSFHLRFYQKFNAFKILKYLNFSHGKYYEKVDLDEQLFMLNAVQKHCN